MKPSETARRRLAVHTIGCRLNQYESEKIAADLAPLGFTRVEDSGSADLTIINTCTVTHRADSDCRQIIKRAVRANPDGRVVVTGCYVDHDPERVLAMPGVTMVVANAQKDQVAKLLPEQMPELFAGEPELNCSAHVTDFYGHNRAWLKVSDGCNQWCSFCIIPRVRGRLRNRAAAEIISDVRALANAGYREVVLTGVHLGHYKHRTAEPQMVNLAALCRSLLDKTDIHRLRLSSLEPQTLREDLISLYSESAGRICRHFHLPLQSGSSRILKLMLRPYDQATYIKRVSAVRKAVPGTVIGADVIVGFPGETDEDFRHTVSLVSSGLIDYLHVFSYSDRPGTQASKLKDKVSPETIRERAALLTEISDSLRLAALQRMIGSTLEVIAEHKPNPDGSFLAVGDNYMKVQLPPHLHAGKEIHRVKITARTDEYLTGDVIQSVSAH